MRENNRKEELERGEIRVHEKSPEFWDAASIYRGWGARKFI